MGKMKKPGGGKLQKRELKELKLKKLRLKKLKVIIAVIFACGLTMFAVGCATTTSKPNNVDNVCDIFRENPRWYKSAKKSVQKWGGNIQLPMAIIYQESTFRRKARPERSKILGFIPGKRPSNAYGYAQALKGTWGEYEKAVGRNKSRDNFGDAFDFVQWYIHQSHVRNGVSKWDYDGHYLNYHEGQGGYSRGTHLKKQWLLNTAARVDRRAVRFGSQLSSCKTELDAVKRGWF